MTLFSVTAGNKSKKLQINEKKKPQLFIFKIVNSFAFKLVRVSNRSPSSSILCKCVVLILRSPGNAVPASSCFFHRMTDVEVAVCFLDPLMSSGKTSRCFMIRPVVL